MIKKVSRLWAVALVAMGMVLVGVPAGVMAGPVDPTGPDGPNGPEAVRFGAIRGIVIDAHGDPVEGAVVRLIHPRTKRVVKRGETNAEGHFGFRHVRMGRYVVEAGKRGVGKGASRVGVRPHAVSRVKVELGR
jgi:Carboxypeptidase regulatory-like domain